MANSTKATEPTATDETPEEWEDIRIGLGDEWDFERDGPLVGRYVATIPDFVVPDMQSREPGATRTTNVYQFEPDSDSTDTGLVFVWGSAQLDAAFQSEEVRIGDRMRLSYLGVDQFNSADGPRTIKRYRVQVSKRS